MQMTPLLFMYYLLCGVIYVRLCTPGLSKVKRSLNSDDVISQRTKGFPIEIKGEKVKVMEPSRHTINKN
jgi:hypothetical protein